MHSAARLYDAGANELQIHLQERALAWGVSVQNVVGRTGAVFAFGVRAHQPVVLKVVECPADERGSGPVLQAFGGRGMVRALEHADGAVLLERLLPGRALIDEAVSDDEASEIMADVIDRMSPGPPPSSVPTIESWGNGFERHKVAGAAGIPPLLIDAAHRIHEQLCASQANTRLLHGDLHHQNVLLDSDRGWLAIDPKGVVGELEYEIGAALRNPCDRPDVFGSPLVIRSRVDRFARALRLDATRILAWAFAQTVLAAIWELEDDGVLRAGVGWIALAGSLRTMLK